MLNFEFPPVGGGAANANYYLLREFKKKKDLQIDLITCSGNNKFEIEQFSKNIRIYRLNVKKKNVHFWRMSEIIRWLYKAYSFAKKIVKKTNYDLCHCWFGWPSGCIGYTLGIPYIVALRGSGVPGYNPRLRFLDKFIFTPLSKKVWDRAKIVTTNSEGLKNLALKTFERRIEVIYNGVDTSEFKPDYSIKKELRLICVSRLIKRKGIEYLINALKGLENVSLTIIGKGNLEDRLKKLVKKLKVNIKFLGNVPHEKIMKYYKNSDVFVLPSLNEGMSNTVLEAAASGLALIVTDTGGTKELVKENGIIIKKKSIESIKKAIIKIQKNKKLLLDMAKQSRAIAKKMTWENTAKNYIEVYKKC